MKSLKEIREERGIKQKAVAEYLGVERQTYANYEANPSSLSIGQAKSVSEFLNCSIDEIFLSADVN